ncbi:MAG: hypothetical protein HN731_13315, partial [Rhodospirillaceae bacterium]|nr:hypothetical protein [Rhodospirillaceae bacterium]
DNAAIKIPIDFAFVTQPGTGGAIKTFKIAIGRQLDLNALWRWWQGRPVVIWNAGNIINAVSNHFGI